MHTAKKGWNRKTLFYSHLIEQFLLLFRCVFFIFQFHFLLCLSVDFSCFAFCVVDRCFCGCISFCYFFASLFCHVSFEYLAYRIIIFCYQFFRQFLFYFYKLYWSAIRETITHNFTIENIFEFEWQSKRGDDKLLAKKTG